MENKFTATYFIEKFEAIPEVLWCAGELINGNARCANGHCGVVQYSKPTDEALALNKLFKDELQLRASFRCDERYDETMEINDASFIQYQQPTPKQRILAALYDIKAMQDKATPQAKPEPEGVTMTFEKLKVIQPIYQS